MTGIVNGMGGQTPPGGVFDSVRAQLGGYMQRYASGEFDDPTIAAQLAASQQRLAASATVHTAAIATPGVPAAGANAGPPATTVFDASSGLIRDEATVQRLLVQQAEARYANIDAALRADFPQADLLPSAETGWDPATFVPTTPADAEAFSQRVVVDATRAAARLEVLVATRDAATVVARTTTDPSAAAKLVELGRLVDDQIAYVDKLAAIVDSSSSGALTDAGARTMRAAFAGNAEAADVVRVGAAAKRSGASDQVAERLVGAAAIARERVSGRAGADRRVTAIAKDVSEFTWTNRHDLSGARAREERRIEARRSEERREEARRRDVERTREHQELQDAIARDVVERWEYVQGVVLRAEQRSEDSHVELLRAIDRRRGREHDAPRTNFEQWMRSQALAGVDA